MTIEVVKKYNLISVFIDTLSQKLPKSFSNCSNYEIFRRNDLKNIYIEANDNILTIKLFDTCKHDLFMIEKAIDDTIEVLNNLPITATIYKEYLFLDTDPDLRKVKVGK